MIETRGLRSAGQRVVLYLAIAVDFYMTITKMCQEFCAQLLVAGWLVGNKVTKATLRTEQIN